MKLTRRSLFGSLLAVAAAPHVAKASAAKGTPQDFAEAVVDTWTEKDRDLFRIQVGSKTVGIPILR